MAVRRNPGGRPSKFTTAAALAVVAELCRGGSLEAAAKSAGIGPSSLYRWIAAGPPGRSAVLSPGRRRSGRNLGGENRPGLSSALGKPLEIPVRRQASVPRIGFHFLMERKETIAKLPGDWDLAHAIRLGIKPFADLGANSEALSGSQVDSPCSCRAIFESAPVAILQSQKNREINLFFG